MAAATPARCIASSFSLTMRRYSAGGQVPDAMSKVRRRIVSHEANVRRAIAVGSVVLAVRRRFGMR